MALALADEPTDRAAADPARADMFVKAAKMARSADEALAALDHALQQDPDHLEANLLRAERLVEKRQIGPATEQIARVKELIGKQADPPAETKARLASLERVMGGLREQATRWSATKQLFVTRYKGMVDSKAATLLPSTTLALRRATLLAPADKDLAAQYEAIDAQAPRLPIAASRPDVDGAKLLQDQGRRQMASAHNKEAADLLRDAVSLNAALPEAWIDLANCLNSLGDVKSAAACLVRARDCLIDLSDRERAARIEQQVRPMLEKLDPKLKQLDEADRQLALNARSLADRAKEGGDTVTVELIQTELKAILGRGVGESASGPDALASKLNWEADTLKIEPDPGTVVTRFRDHVVMAVDRGYKTKPGSPLRTIGAEITLGDLTFPDDGRICWRVESVKSPKRGPVVLHSKLFFSNSIYYVREDIPRPPGEKSWIFGLTDSGSKMFKPLVYFPNGPTSKDVYRADGIYDIRLEKIAGKVTVWVNSTELLELKLPKDMLANFAKTPVGIHVWQGDWWSGQENWAGPYEIGFKVSVVELAMGKKLTPWRPK